MYFPRHEYEDRWKRVRAEMRIRGHQTLVVWQRSAGGFDRAGHGYWLTNYASLASGQEPSRSGISVGSGFAAIVFRGDREPELHIAEPVEAVDVTRIVAGEIYSHSTDLPGGLGKHLSRRGVEGPVTYVGEDFLPVLFDRSLRAATPQIQWIADDVVMVEPQYVKSPLELEAYRRAGDIATRSLNALMQALIAGESESEAAARAASVIIRAGGGFQRVAANHGAHSERYFWSDPMYSYTTAAPETGDIVRGWVYGPLFQGYWIDPGRTGVCGNEPTSAQRALIEGVNSIVTAMLEAVRPGVTPRQIGVIGEAQARRVGYYDYPQTAALWELFGHGLGSFWQPPIPPSQSPATIHIADEFFRVDEPYRPGMVATLEAFLTHTDIGTGACEQCFIVTEAGIELLTTTPLTYW